MKQLLKSRFLLAAFILFAASACKKKDSEPIAITVTAKTVSVLTNNISTATIPSDITIIFDYNGSEKRATLHTVSDGVQTGTGRISNPDIVPPICSFISTGYPESVGINSMNLPDTIQIDINTFDGVYNYSLNKGINKVTLLFDANTKFYMSGLAEFSTYTASNVPVFRAKTLSILSKLNDWQTSIPGNQPLPVLAYVQD